MVYVITALMIIAVVIGIVMYYQFHLNQVKIINNQFCILQDLTALENMLSGPHDYLVIKKWYNGTQSGTVIRAADKTEALQIATKDGKEHKEYDLNGIY